MTDPRPLLAFGPPIAGPIPTGKSQFQPPPVGPSGVRQGERIAPQFASLQQAISSKRMQTASSNTAPDPELVVVFDLAGSVTNFIKAVSRIEGLEFLAEFGEEDVESDDDFHFMTREGDIDDKLVPETLYAVMSNSRAVSELIRLFDLWRANPELKMERGLAPLKGAFGLLRGIRRWGAEDRVRETGLLDAWREDVAISGSSGKSRVEIELWFRETAEQRERARLEVTSVLDNAGATIVKSAVIESIDYHAILADVPMNQVELVLANGPESIELLTTESVMFVSVARPMTVPSIDLAEGEFDPASLPLVNDGPPRVALIDGLPISNHAALSGRLVVDDPDGLADSYTSNAQRHGTGMASLILHGDLSRVGASPTRRIYVRPIMRPHEFFDGTEVVVNSELLVDLIRRVFHRMFEGDGAARPVAPSVRLVNLSIGDPSRAFTRRLSPLAKMLDWLAHRYNVLILVSAGNQDVDIRVDAGSLSDPDRLTKEVLASNHQNARLRRIYSPAEAVNVVTVGAQHLDWAKDAASDLVVDTLEPGMPATYSPLGFGHRRSVKPEILMPGGRQLHQRPPAPSTGLVTLVPAEHAAVGPGILVAAPSTVGGVRGTAFTTGTSNATALATRAAESILGLLETTTAADGDFPFPDAQYHPVLTKALLVHAASWQGTDRSLIDALELSGSSARRDITQMLGYGPVDLERLATADRIRPMLIGAGSTTAGQRQLFSFPLPASLAATTEWRRLTITLAWLSPINARSQIHRMARIWFQPPHEQLGTQRTEADSNAVRKGTVQHEVFEGSSALAFAVGDSLAIDVDCRIDAGSLDAPVRFALVASLEMAQTVRADLHAEVRDVLRVQVRQRQAVIARP